MLLPTGLRRLATGTLLAGATLISTQALAGYLAHVSVKAQKQGQFKSESDKARRNDKWIPVLSFSASGESPRDMASGQASGKRQWKPVCLVKQSGASTPQFFQAMATNENLPEVNFEFSRTNPNGEEYVYQTVKLTDASVTKIHTHTANTAEDGTSSKHTATADTMQLEEICFSFRKIEISNADGKTSFMDSWAAQP
jgi:type VI secretion system secreted protein Hcp